ncbi:MAG: hypothetical protein ACYSTW_12585, partial [Planctomycetota bacterium]
LCQLKHPQNDQYAIPAGCRELKIDIYQRPVGSCQISAVKGLLLKAYFTVTLSIYCNLPG